MNKQMIEFNLDAILAKRGITKYRLAKDTNIAHTTIWKLETGKAQRVGFDVLGKICNRLDCELTDFLFIHRDKETRQSAAKKTAKKAAKRGAAK
jgi:DNA-binding Xre family transcriptional regulator